MLFRSPKGERPKASPKLKVSREKLGEGQFAEVFQGFFGTREVAVKVLCPKKAGKRASKLLEDAAAEAAVVRNVRHPALTELLGVCGAAIISELVHGTPLATVLYPNGGTTGPGLQGGACPLVAHLAAGIAHLHERGIVHRDMKPENVLVWQEGGIFTGKVIDFGLALRLGPSASKRHALDGSPLYAAPECFALSDVACADDVWALACVAAEAFGSGRPFAGATSLEHLAALVQTTPPFARLPPLPPALATCLHACFAPASWRASAPDLQAAASCR